MKKIDLIHKRSELQRKILTMEWDLKRHQLHVAKKEKLEELKKELEELDNQINQNQTPQPPPEEA